MPEERRLFWHQTIAGPTSDRYVAALWMAIIFVLSFKDRKSVNVGVCRPRGNRRPLQKVGGEALTFWKGIRGPRGRPDPKVTDF